MKFYTLIILILFSITTFSQSLLKGVITDSKDNPVFAANVYFKNNPQKGAITNITGNFILPITFEKDTLIVSFIGFETKKIPLQSIAKNEFLKVILIENNQSLEEVTIKAQDPISEKNSVIKLKKLDVYFNPVSQGDPLKAITILPASTTTDESASPSLRGSSPDRTRVVLNDVPIYNPVLNSQIDGIGNFSIFNTEIIDKQYVYASNPPLIYGNTSAGLVEIETIKELPDNQLQLSASLASTGFFLSQKENDKTFIQVFGNYQFPDAYMVVNKTNLQGLKNFDTKDIGINLHCNIDKRVTINSFSYFIDDGSIINIEKFNYSGDLLLSEKRYFTVNNFKYLTNNGVLSINGFFNNSKSNFNFGNMESKKKNNQIYGSINYKWYILENTNLQFGVSNDYQHDKFNDIHPVYYYAVSPELPSDSINTNLSNNNLESYAYFSWDIAKKWTFSSGIRSNIPLNKQNYYLSSQVGLKYKLNERQSFLLSGGKYHNYSTPNYNYEKYELLQSFQIALDYSYKFNNTLINSAAYFKNETGNQITSDAYFITNKINTSGLELFVEQIFLKYFKFTFSNTFLNQTMEIDSKEYKVMPNFNYLIKTSLSYNNPKLFSLSLSYITRSGICYTPIVGSQFDKQTNSYEPQFSADLFSKQYNNYNRFDVSLNRFFKFDKTALVAFVSCNNVLNTKNENEVLYNTDYKETHFNNYLLRTIYFGLVWQLNY